MCPDGGWNLQCFGCRGRCSSQPSRLARAYSPLYKSFLLSLSNFSRMIAFSLPPFLPLSLPPSLSLFLSLSSLLLSFFCSFPPSLPPFFLPSFLLPSPQPSCSSKSGTSLCPWSPSKHNCTDVALAHKYCFFFSPSLVTTLFYIFHLLSNYYMPGVFTR